MKNINCNPEAAMVPETKNSLVSFVDLTDEKAAEEELLDTRQKLLSIIEFLPDATFVVDQARKVIAWNRAIEDMTGIHKEDIIGSGDYAYAIPFYGVARPILIDHVFEDEKSGRYQYKLHYQKEKNTLFAEEFAPALFEGRGAYVWVKASPLLDVEGNIVGAVESIRDVTQNRIVENELRASQERYRALYHAFGGGVIVLGKNNRIVEINKAALDIHQIPDGEDPDHFFCRLDYFDENGLPLSFAELPTASVMESGKSIHGIVIGFKRKGANKTVWVQSNSVPLFDRCGQVEGVVVTLMDITTRKEIETELARRNEFSEQILQTSGIIILVIDTSGKILIFNHFGERLTGYREKEIVGKDWLDTLIPKKEQGKLAGIINEIKEKGYAKGENFVLGRDNREILVKWNASILNSSTNGEQGFLVVGHDVSKLRTVEAQLIQAQKMEAVGRLAGGIAHDFNNILTGIIGNASSILTDITPDCEYYEALREVEDSALMAADIVEKLLGFSRKSLMKSAVVNVNDNINEAYKIIKRTIDPRIILKTRLEDNLWPAAADRTQITQVLINLCLNAQDAMPDGGSITIKTENIILDENSLKSQPSYVRAGEFVRISVADTGCGMPAEVQEQVFEPFFTTKKAGHGTGLGLAMVYGIVKQQEGWINCHSEVGQGTTFTICLPRAVLSPLPVSPDEVPDRKAHISGSKTVLVVEDNRIVKNFIKRILSRKGFQVIIAGDGKEAVDLYRLGWKNIDLVLLDMTIPRLSGRDALIIMKKINPSIKVLLTSGYLFSDKEEPLLSKYRFLHKPFTENDLLKQMENLLYAGKK
ncbi:PAS domain-containing hybrid sensor histidine kinase/response regulator [Pelotomaculum propionicicum]|uniref:PAS domain-containing hybrid sensor histidine kinase/response regulator n=1 Tax=Pelotomaculum propionicicum TaxID=258475 RepID=UPI003B7C9856